MPTSRESLLPPGSPEAVRFGCICPVDRNAGGMGMPEHSTAEAKVFFTNTTCLLHGDEEWAVEARAAREAHSATEPENGTEA